MRNSSMGQGKGFHVTCDVICGGFCWAPKAHPDPVKQTGGSLSSELRSKPCKAPPRQQRCCSQRRCGFGRQEARFQLGSTKVTGRPCQGARLGPAVLEPYAGTPYCLGLCPKYPTCWCASPQNFSGAEGAPRSATKCHF